MILDLWNQSLPRIELDSGPRDARLGLERTEREVVPRPSVPASWKWRPL
jgi:hypothetical protein